MIPSDGLSGFGDVNNEIGTENILYNDGDNETYNRIDSIDRTVKFTVANTVENEPLRHRAIEFFNAKRSYKCIIHYMGLERWCEGKLSKVAISEGNIYKPVTVQFTLKCLKPYFYSMDNFGKDIASVMPLEGFPFHSYAKWGGHPTGYYNFDRSVRIVNDGDVETKARVVINALGDVVNPSFFINGKYVKVLDIMARNDQIEINFDAVPPTVKKNGVNIMGKCDRSSEFSDMDIKQGDNIIKYRAEQGDTLMTCSVYYNKRYLMI
jgi:hypothetical protein